MNTMRSMVTEIEQAIVSINTQIGALAWTQETLMNGPNYGSQAKTTVRVLKQTQDPLLTEKEILKSKVTTINRLLYELEQVRKQMDRFDAMFLVKEVKHLDALDAALLDRLAAEKIDWEQRKENFNL